MQILTKNNHNHHNLAFLIVLFNKMNNCNNNNYNNNYYNNNKYNSNYKTTIILKIKKSNTSLPKITQITIMMYFKE